MCKSKQGEISPDLLLGFNAAVEDNLDSRPNHHDPEDDHEHDEDITSVHVVLDQGFDPTELVNRLQSLVQQHEIYRIKGFVAVPNKAMRLVVQGVGNRFEPFSARPWQPDEPRQTRLVFIGRAFNLAQVSASIQEGLSAR